MFWVRAEIGSGHSGKFRLNSPVKGFMLVWCVFVNWEWHAVMLKLVYCLQHCKTRYCVVFGQWNGWRYLFMFYVINSGLYTLSS